MDTLLVIADDPGVLSACTRACAGGGAALVSAVGAVEGLEAIDRHRPGAVVLGLAATDPAGLELIGRLRELDPALPVLVVGGGATGSAIEAIKRGAFDYLTRPVDVAALRALIGRALQVSRMVRRVAPGPSMAGEAVGDGHAPATALRPVDVGPAGPAGEALVGFAPGMQEVYKAIGRVAPTDVTVLVRGESGTGKELVARAIHQHSRRAGGPFLAINCAAIPEGLLESELFGHEAGAFTGAERRRPGKFEQAHGGTLLLDEIGDLAPMAQAKVLRAIQEGQFQRVGGVETIRADVRLIAATHQDLRTLARQGRFREDLYYRLGVFGITLPPLRDRLEDLPALVDHFVRRGQEELGREVRQVAPETLDRLRAYGWPGNIRELQSVLKQAMLHCQGPVLLPEFLPPPIGSPARTAPGPTGWEAFVAARLAAGSTTIYDEALAEMERQILGRVLRHTRGNQLQAARLLGITRGTLRTKIRALGLDLDALADGPAD